MNDIIINNMIFSSSEPQIGDRCLIIQNGNDRYCVPLKSLTNDFYRCASVNTENNTWTGYKAILSNGSYSFEQNVTENLSCGNGFVPIINEIYDKFALIHVADLYTRN